jgi:hypothetical protein
MRNPLSSARLVPLLENPWILFGFALSVRIWVLLKLLPAQMQAGFYEKNEPARIAWCLVSGYGFSSPWPHTALAPTAQQPPVYPCLLAGIFQLTGAYTYASLWVAVGLNAAASSLTAVLILKLGKRDFGVATGIVAAWIWAVWVYEAVVSVRLWESSLSALMLVCALQLLGSLEQSSATTDWLLFGLLGAISALTNTTLLSLFPFFWAGLWLSHRRRGETSAKLLLVSVAACVLALLPWSLRNYARFHRFIPVRDNLGLELWIGNHPGVTHLYDFSGFPLRDPAEYNRLGELGFMEAERAIAVRFIAQHPREFLRLSAERCFAYWTSPEPALWLPFGLLAWFGSALLYRRAGAKALPYAVVLLIFPVIYYVTHPWPTYRHPTEPVMLLLAAYAGIGLAKRLRPGVERGGPARWSPGLSSPRPAPDAARHRQGPACREQVWPGHGR